MVQVGSFGSPRLLAGQFQTPIGVAVDGRQGVRRRQRERAHPALQREGRTSRRPGGGASRTARRRARCARTRRGARRASPARVPASSRIPRASPSTAPRASRKAPCTSATRATTWSEVQLERQAPVDDRRQHRPAGPFPEPRGRGRRWERQRVDHRCRHRQRRSSSTATATSSRSGTPVRARGGIAVDSTNGAVYLINGKWRDRALHAHRRRPGRRSTATRATALALDPTDREPVRRSRQQRRGLRPHGHPDRHALLAGRRHDDQLAGPRLLSPTEHRPASKTACMSPMRPTTS